jgi:hypothetical protein
MSQTGMLRGLLSMSTPKQPQSQRNSGNTSAAQRLTAERNRCPKCGRKQALRFYSDDLMFGMACRWEDCGHERMTLRS